MEVSRDKKLLILLAFERVRLIRPSVYTTLPWTHNLWTILWLFLTTLPQITNQWISRLRHSSSGRLEKSCFIWTTKFMTIIFFGTLLSSSMSPLMVGPMTSRITLIKSVQWRPKVVYVHRSIHMLLGSGGMYAAELRSKKWRKNTLHAREGLGPIVEVSRKIIRVNGPWRIPRWKFQP